jgi:hypothetical protein
MKTSCFSRLQRTLACGVTTLLGLVAVHAIDPDLPYSIPAAGAGADGPLTFRQIIPAGLQHVDMAYDPGVGKVILFGGNGPTGPSSETWEWNGGDWVRLSPATSPPGRYGHRMVYDSVRDEIVMFGGYRNGPLSDTWVYKNGNWSEKSPANVPTARYYHNMVFDAHPDRQKVLLTGGANANERTWVWDGTNWTQLTPATDTPSHQYSGMAYDAVRGEVVLFNGWAQTWTWNGVNWTLEAPETSPSARGGTRMEFDPVRGEAVLFGGDGRGDTWAWNGVNWTQRQAVSSARGSHDMVWHAGRQRLVAFGGSTSIDGYSADTLEWDGTAWSQISGKVQVFDMNSRPSGIWNFTTINVPFGVTVNFKRNAGNTPVRWLATGDVVINGTLDVSGDRGANALGLGLVAQGGPGGFPGGRGAVRKDQSGSNVGSPGQGPGGGLPGTAQQTSPQNLRDAQPGNYSDVGNPGSYGNVFIQPLVGGSGGGGGSSSDNTSGGNGGGGGGAIFIASSRDIIINGSVAANGGDIDWTGASYGGRGSGGAILLRADRISGNGQLDAYGGNAGTPNGRIRLEAYYRQLAGQTRPISVNSAPIANTDFNTLGALTVTQVAGQNVAQPPSGNTLTPDVIFTAAGPISVRVSGVGIPVGTPVKLRITTSEGVIPAGPVNLGADNTVEFTGVNVPAGIGTVQAFAEFQVSN